MEWRSLPEWPDYEVSERGDVRRTRGARAAHARRTRGGPIRHRRPYLCKTGYLYIVMRNRGVKCACAVHRLVARAFLGEPPSHQHQVAHLDGDRVNNHWRNLQWCTRSENERHKVAHGTSNRGERMGRSRLTEKQVIDIKRALARGENPAVIGRRIGIGRQTINAIRRGRSWAWLTLPYMRRAA